MIQTTRQQRRQLKRDNQKQPSKLIEVPKELWPNTIVTNKPIKVWRSKFFFAQLYNESNGYQRLSVCKSSLNDVGRWDDGITWDELMQVKRECGFADIDALEIFPADKDIVNVANMRHLFIPPEPINFAWRK